MRKLIESVRNQSNTKKLIAVLVVIIFVLILVVSIYLYYLEDKVSPNVYIRNQHVGLLTKEEAINRINTDHPDKLELVYEDSIYEINLDKIFFEYDNIETVEKAYAIGRSDALIDNAWHKIKSLYRITRIEPSVKYDTKLLDEYLSIISGEIVETPTLPSLSKVDGAFQLNPGKTGTQVDLASLKNEVSSRLSEGSYSVITINTIKTPTLGQEEAVQIQNKANQLLGKSITAYYENQTITFGDLELAQIMLPQNDVEKITNDVRSKVDRKPQNALFTFVDSHEGPKKIVKEFKPGMDGLEVNVEEFRKLLLATIDQLALSDVVEIEVLIPLKTTKPEITTESVNNHGIRELIGQGKSKFVGSIPSRVHNVGVASEKFNGVLIEPGSVFSFNDIVGDISVLTGYQQAYIIKDGATVLGDGGGVCQVSTTLFRAALDAGLPIVDRRGHSYRVSYYEQDSAPGLDATVYSPTTDLKVLNDTPAYILIQTNYDAVAKTLEFEIYGTSDGRVSTISKPKITSSTPPPEDLYTDDPNMKVGEVKQIDWKAWGAKVNFDYKVERDGQVIYEKTFYSNYQPWQAKFLRGTAAI